MYISYQFEDGVLSIFEQSGDFVECINYGNILFDCFGYVGGEIVMQLVVNVEFVGRIGSQECVIDVISLGYNFFDFIQR